MYDREVLLAELWPWVAAGGTVSEFCRQPGRPTRETVYAWLREEPDLRKRYGQAQELGNLSLEDEFLDTARTPMPGEIETIEEWDEEVENGEGEFAPRRSRKLVREDMLGHRKHVCWAILQLLARRDPERWSNKVNVAHKGKVTLEQLVTASWSDDEERTDG